MLILSHVLTDRGSKYAASGAPCGSQSEVTALLRTLKRNKKFARATHNSWGVLLSAGPLKGDDG